MQYSSNLNFIQCAQAIERFERRHAGVDHSDVMVYVNDQDQRISYRWTNRRVINRRSVAIHNALRYAHECIEMARGFKHGKTFLTTAREWLHLASNFLEMG